MTDENINNSINGNHKHEKTCGEHFMLISWVIDELCLVGFRLAHYSGTLVSLLMSVITSHIILLHPDPWDITWVDFNSLSRFSNQDNRSIMSIVALMFCCCPSLPWYSNLNSLTQGNMWGLTGLPKSNPLVEYRWPYTLASESLTWNISAFLNNI